MTDTASKFGLVLEKLPLFPLGTVLFPGAVLPLKIFEVRYLDMIRRCIDGGAPFGVVSLTQGHEVATPGMSESFAQVGTLATIMHHESPQPGLKLVRCLGQQRFRITRSERLKHGLWVAEVSSLPEEHSFTVPDELASCRSMLENLLSRIPKAIQRDLLPARPTEAQWSDCGWLANRWCQLLPLSVEFKQRLLELDSPLIRLELVSDMLDKLRIRVRS